MPPHPKFQQNKLLSELSTFGIGGPARYFQEIRSKEEMQEALRFCKRESLPYLILGKGSNCLFDDRGFVGVVLLNKIEACHWPQPDIVYAGAGYSFSLLGVQTARQEWSGLEFASGIPASVGGAVFMNAGANGNETCHSLHSVDYVNEEGDLCLYDASTLSFAYRSSPFQNMRGAIVGASFKLSKLPEARQKQIDIINYRKKTQPLREKSAGCIFRNPNCGHAGALIEQCGLKGVSVGGAQVSEVHANFLINKGQATAQEVLALIALVQEKVKEGKNIHLEPEVRCIPFEPH